MESEQAALLFEALSSKSRLDIYRLLVKFTPDGLVAGEISKKLNIPPSNLTFHLKAIVSSGLASVVKEGRFLRYRADVPLMLEVIGYLIAECCNGKPDKCFCYPADLIGKPITLPSFKEPEKKEENE